ncbi:MAG: PulJ/GspJ family protein [Rubripirellula sp.]
MRMSNSSRSKKKQPAAGYTLLEIVITLGLSAALLTAIYNSLNSVLQLASKGESKTLELNLARGVLQRIDRDLRQFADSRPDYLQDFLADQFPEDFANVRQTPPAFHLAGSHQMLLVKHLRGSEHPHVARSAPNLDESGEHLVAYFHSTHSFHEELSKNLREVGFNLVGGEETKGLANGLHRCFLRLSASSRDVQIVSIDDSFERQEFFDLRFRYFDGQAWQFTSDLLNDRVTAVETVIRIDTRSTSEPGFVNPMPESPNNTYRLTSILPGASPQEGHSL